MIALIKRTSSSKAQKAMLIQVNLTIYIFTFTYLRKVWGTKCFTIEVNEATHVDIVPSNINHALISTFH